MQTIQNAIGGKLVTSSSSRTQPVYNPATGEAISTLPLSSVDEINDAVAAAKATLPGWASTTPMKRARVMFKFKELLEKHADELASLISLEHGKVHDDALGELARGIDCVDFACGIPQMLKGEFFAQCRPVDRQLFRPPAAWRRRRHHAVQLPGYGANVDVSARDRMREHFHPEAVRARSVGADVRLAAVHGCGPTRGAC